MNIGNVSTTDLVMELRRRCTCSAIGLLIKDGHPEANVRVFMQCEKGVDTLQLIGLAELLHSDVMAAARHKMGMPENGQVDG